MNSFALPTIHPFFTYPFIPRFFSYLHSNAQMEQPVSSPTPDVVTAMRRISSITRECERVMPSTSFSMMKKALFTVYLFFGLLLLVCFHCFDKEC